jgi:hypothetical protein
MTALNGFDGAVILGQKKENPFAALDYDGKDAGAFITWWRHTAFPNLKDELGTGTVKWTTTMGEWCLIVIDEISGLQLVLMRPAAEPGDKPFYLEPVYENIEKITAVLKAARVFHASARAASPRYGSNIRYFFPAPLSNAGGERSGKRSYG